MKSVIEIHSLDRERERERERWYREFVGERSGESERTILRKGERVFKKIQ